MKIYKELEQGTEEWLQVRAGKITGSEIYPLITASKGTGKGGYKSYCRKKAVEKMFGIETASFKNGAMQQGTEREPIARLAYELLTGVNVVQVGFVELSDFVGCSPDGLIGEDGILEIKSKTDDCHAKLLLREEDFEANYIWQAYYVAYVCGRQWADLISYNPHFGKSSIYIKHLERTPEIDEIIERAITIGIDNIQEYIDKLKNLM